jgi:hypothetical protein
MNANPFHLLIGSTLFDLGILLKCYKNHNTRGDTGGKTSCHEETILLRLSRPRYPFGKSQTDLPNRFTREE